MQVSLTDGWTVEAIGGDVPAFLQGVSVPAAVPGCVHLDLMAAGLIPDPYLDSNAAECAWIGRVDWRYRTAFDWDGPGAAEIASQQVDLVALGLDTVAAVELNGTVIGQTKNMHRSYRFDVAALLRPGGNELSVTFTGAVTAADAADARDHRLYLGALGNPHPFNAIRKMACNYGWDWGPDLATVGIWRPLYLQTWSGVRIASVRPLVTVDGRTGILDAHVELQRAPGMDETVTVEVQVAGHDVAVEVPAGRNDVEVQVEVPDARLWWPHGYGDQPLYPVGVTATAPGRSRDHWQARVGFRTVELDTTNDEVGTPFTIRINGVAVFARGANWIPDDCFPSRVTRPRLAHRLSQARDANMNMLRVWGGGLYESDDFYDLADEMGLLVWQDFLFACAAYSEREPLAGEVVAEAREAVTRLSPHPSLVLWNGCNENIWGYEDWDWKGPLAGLDWGLGYYLQVLPAIVAELDPTRPYSPGSPYSMSQDIHPNDPNHGTMHVWDVWNERDYPGYRDYVPRFASEFGWQGPPTWTTLTRAVHDDPLRPESAGMLFHQKAEGGNAKLTRGLEPHLALPESMPDWHWAMSLNQARAIRFALEHFRSWMGRCMGSLVWQLNDCWPVTSWAAVDGNGREKPLWYAIRHAYADRLLTVQPRDGGLAVVAVNDSAEAWHGHVEVRRHGFDGTSMAEATVALDVPARGVATLPIGAELATPTDPAAQALTATAPGAQRAWWFFAEDRDTDLAEPRHQVHLHRVEGGYRITVTAQTLLKDVAVLADRLAPDAVVDDMLVTLLPGESAAFTVTTGAELTGDQVADPLVLRCANQLVAAAQPERIVPAGR